MMPAVQQPRPYETYRVSAKHRGPLIEWMCSALEEAGCRVISSTPPNEAPFQIAFELATGERRGIVAYAFLANNERIKNRPADEHRFQVKYGSEFKRDHEVWQDEFGLYTTLFLGINPKLDIFVAADPWLHRVTRFSKSIEFKDEHVEKILETGWHAWQRERRPGKRRPNEDEDALGVLIGGSKASFLKLVVFEREALREDQGHRQLLAEKASSLVRPVSGRPHLIVPVPTMDRLHALTKELELDASEVLDLIQSAPRLKMAVRGWVAETHLLRLLETVPGVTSAEPLRREGGADLSVQYEGRRLVVECKNVARVPTKDGLATLDFQRTRSSQGDPCSRFYDPTDFDMVAACLHARTRRWEFRFADPRALDRRTKNCTHKLSNNVRIDDRWKEDAAAVLRAVSR